VTDELPDNLEDIIVGSSVDPIYRIAPDSSYKKNPPFYELPPIGQFNIAEMDKSYKDVTRPNPNFRVSNQHHKIMRPFAAS